MKRLLVLTTLLACAFVFFAFTNPGDSPSGNEAVKLTQKHKPHITGYFLQCRDGIATWYNLLGGTECTAGGCAGGLWTYLFILSENPCNGLLANLGSKVETISQDHLKDLPFQADVVSPSPDFQKQTSGSPGGDK